MEDFVLRVAYVYVPICTYSLCSCFCVYFCFSRLLLFLQISQKVPDAAFLRVASRRFLACADDFFPPQIVEALTLFADMPFSDENLLAAYVSRSDRQTGRRKDSRERDAKSRRLVEASLHTCLRVGNTMHVQEMGRTPFDQKNLSKMDSSVWGQYGSVMAALGMCLIELCRSSLSVDLRCLSSVSFFRHLLAMIRLPGYVYAEETSFPSIPASLCPLLRFSQMLPEDKPCGCLWESSTFHKERKRESTSTKALLCTQSSVG